MDVFIRKQDQRIKKEEDYNLFGKIRNNSVMRYLPQYDDSLHIKNDHYLRSANDKSVVMLLTFINFMMFSQYSLYDTICIFGIPIIIYFSQEYMNYKNNHCNYRIVTEIVNNGYETKLEEINYWQDWKNYIKKNRDIIIPYCFVVYAYIMSMAFHKYSGY